jgi:aminoglycoside phosphotransferase (APT) family kinase protein
VPRDSLSDEDAPRWARALEALFPEIGTVGRPRRLGSGFEGEVFETPEGWTIRIAREAGAGRRLELEARLLPRLAPHLPCPVPEPIGFRRGEGRLEPGVIVYPKLPGEPVDPPRLSPVQRDSVAAELGRFLDRLHRFPVEEARALGVPGDPGPPRDEWKATRTAVLPVLKRRLPAEAFERVVTWWDELLADPELERFAPVLLHGDPWYGNILLATDGRRLAGVLDFGRAHIGDPAQDFAALRSLGPAFVSRTFDVYRGLGQRPGANFARRSDRYWQQRDFGGLADAIRTDDRDEIEDSLRKLRTGPVLAVPTGQAPSDGSGLPTGANA